MIKIIPAIDIINGKCVRLVNGNYLQKTTYEESPIETAKKLDANGIKYLHLVDLDGAKAKKIVNYNILKEIAEQTNLTIDFGGGIRSKNDLQIAFQNGAAKVTIGSLAVKERETAIEWIKKYGEKIILGADAQNEKIAINAWETKTNLSIINFINEFLPYNIKTVIVTDIARDGLLKGPSFNLYKKIKKQIPQIELIASGGISSINDIEKLNEMNIDGVIIGKALHEGKIKLNELKRFLC